MANYRGKKYVPVDLSVPRVFLSGYVRHKQVKPFGKAGGSSGIIYVPTRFIGKEVVMVLIPLEEIDPKDLKKMGIDPKEGTESAEVKI